MAFRSKSLACLAVITFALFALFEWKSEELGAFSLFPNGEEGRSRTAPASKKQEGGGTLLTGGSSSSSAGPSKHNQSRGDVIDLLIGEGVYDSNSFENEAGVVPPFWDDNATSSPCKPDETTTLELGPCFGSHLDVDWHAQANQKDTQIPRYTPLMNGASETTKTKNDWAGYCRPGFLIIGAGKCGTSVRRFASPIILSFVDLVRFIPKMA
jgi:hypothetical protein